MELKLYLNILKKRWWLVVLSVAVVLIATAFLTFRQPNIYEAKATFIMRPRSEFIDNDEFVRSLDVVSRRVEINTTFAEVVGSKLIKDMAVDRLGLTSDERQGLSINGRVIGGTNILEVTVQGPNPTIVRNLTNAVGEETVNYVARLYDVFELEPLDAARVPTTPVKPSPMLNMALGLVFGLVLGAGLVFLLEYLSTPETRLDTFNIIDRETGAYNKSYLMHRLWQEMSRAKHNQYPLALGLVRIEIGDTGEENAVQKQAEALSLVKILAEKLLRPEDILARFNDDTLAVLLPDMNDAQAQRFMQELEHRISSVPQEAGGRRGTLELRSTVSAISYEDHQMRQERFMREAFEILEEAWAKTNNGRATTYAGRYESSRRD